MVLVFVYGSLKRGFRHHREIAGSRYLRATSTAVGYRLVRVEGYPALVSGEGRVSGELYEVDEDRLTDLDRFEDCPALYQRERLTLVDGTRAFAYVMPARLVVGLPEVPGGVWVEE
jgi:gamma-glutamylaminecyclotransferase